MAARTPAMVVRVAANLEELRRNLKEGRDVIEVTTAGMQKLANSFSGDRIVQSAHNVVAAVREIGGAQKLTEAEQARVNATLERAIEKYRVLGQEAPSEMIKLAEATKRVEAPTASATSVFRQFDGVLASLGIHIAPQVKAIEDIAGAAGKSASAIGVLGTAGLTFGAAVGGWKIGRLIAEFFELDSKIAGATARLMGWGDLAAETAAAKTDTLARATAIAEREITNMNEAVRILAAHQQDLSDKYAVSATRIADAQREVRGLSAAKIAAIELAQKLGTSTDVLTRTFHISADALKVLADRQRVGGQAASEHDKAIQALDRSYAKLMSDVKNANQLALMDDAAAALKRQAENANQLRMMERDAHQMQMKEVDERVAAEAAAETARVAQNQREIDAIVNTTQKIKEGGDVGKSSTDQVIAGYAGIAQQVTLTGDAVKEWINLMRYSASVNAVLSEGSSLFTTQSQRERIASLPSPRAGGGPVSAGSPYMVGERGPELFVPSASGTIVPHGAGGTTVVVQIAPGAVVQNFPIGGADPVARQMLTQELGDVFIASMKHAGIGVA